MLILSPANQRNIYASLDITKFIMAMLILMAHIVNEWTAIDGPLRQLFSLYNFAVPFFFACSGFLFFSKLESLPKEEQKLYYRQYSVRLGKMYLVWSLIYFSFSVGKWLLYGVTLSQIGSYFHTVLVYTTYPTIWFLPSLWIGISITYVLSRSVSNNIVFITALCLCLLGAIGGGYEQLLPDQGVIHQLHTWYTKIMITYRNGFFNGMPFVALGMLIAKCPNRLSLGKNLFLTLFFGGTFVIEAVMIKYFQLSSNVDLGISMFPAIYFMLSTLIRLDIKDNTVYRALRDLSMLIFLGQRIFLTAIPGLMPKFSLAIKEQLPDGVILLMFVALVTGFSWSIIHLSKHYKKLKVLW